MEKTSADLFNEVAELEKQQIENIKIKGNAAEEKHRLERELMDIKEVLRKAAQTIAETRLKIEITKDRAWTCKNSGL